MESLVTEDLLTQALRNITLGFAVYKPFDFGKCL